jgi:hypothetical protein
MTSLYGIDPIFDYSFTYPQNVLGTPVEKKGYLQGSIMQILETKYPKFAFIVKTARLDEILSYDNSFFTLFLPVELPSKETIMGMDIQEARTFVKYHLMSGMFPIDLLLSSNYQELNTTIKGQPILAIRVAPFQIVFNNRSQFVIDSLSHAPVSIPCINGFIHLISHPFFSS